MIKPLRAAAGTVLFMVSMASAAEASINLKQECERAFKVYPALMLAVMLESPMNCGEPGTDEYVDCDANETPQQKVAHARRLEIRKHQETAYAGADKACTAWTKDNRWMVCALPLNKL